VKLKKLHKMGDVANTILKHFEKEKIIIDQNKIHIFCIFQVRSLLFPDYRNYQIKVIGKVE
jgi:restriction endonuclease